MLPLPAREIERTLIDLEIFGHDPHAPSDSRHGACQVGLRHVKMTLSVSFEIRHSLDLSSGFAHPPWYTFVVHLRRNILTGTVLASLLAILSGESWGALATDHAVFSTFTRHITRQVSIDKHALAAARTCVSWFCKATKRPPPPAVQGINWRRTL